MVLATENISLVLAIMDIIGVIQVVKRIHVVVILVPFIVWIMLLIIVIAVNQGVKLYINVLPVMKDQNMDLLKPKCVVTEAVFLLAICVLIGTRKSP